MAESSVIYLLEKLADIFENDDHLLGVLFRGVREEGVYLRGEFERMRAFLRTADALQETDQEVEVWVKQVRDVAHEAEDILDEFTLLHKHDHGRGIYGSLRTLGCCIKNAKACYRIASELKAINSRIKNISEVHKRLRHKFIKAEQGPGSDSVGNTWQDRRGDALLLDVSDLVGLDEPKKQLVGWLFKSSPGRKVVSLAGMGGMGKSTLAKQVYDDPEVKKHFKVCAWITVNRSFKSGEILKDMAQQLFKAIRRRVPQVVANMDNDQLKTTIKELLQQRRYLIVLDDVWHLCEWHAIQNALPNNSCGSRIMLTTRNSEVASTTRVLSDGKTYQLKPLPPPESWELFCRKAFRHNKCPPHLEDICKDILKKCEGLPLAIVAISGVLATKDTRRIDEWDMVSRSLGAEIEGNDKLSYLKKVLSLSFSDLPYFLKSCFLYLSIFPEGHLIQRMRLIRLWVAEGFIEAKEGRTLEEVADDYLHELLNRSLMQVATTTPDGRVKTCRIHDLLREIIISKSRDQNFTTIVKEKSVPAQWSDKIRRLSIHNRLQSVQPNRSVSQLRSLFMFGASRKPSITALFPSGFRLLNVLDLHSAPLKRFPVEVVDLYFLKYLSLRETKVKTVPRFIGKLQNLETLDLKHSYVSELPDEILKLQRLRHLLVYQHEFVSYEQFNSKNGFKVTPKIGVLRALQKLCFIEVNQDGGTIIRELGKLTQLRRLGLLKLRKADGKALCSSIAKLSNLRALSIASVKEDETIDLQHLYSPPSLLQRLYMRGRLDALPHWIPSLPSLVRLSLKWSRLKDDPLISLRHIPNLVQLELCQVFVGDRLCFKADGFRKLKILSLEKFDELRCIDVEMGAMECLEKLSIQRCKRLENVPSGIEHLHKLKFLEFSDMPVDLMKTIRPDGKDNWRVSHVPEVYSTYWREGGWEVYSIDSMTDGEYCPLPSNLFSHELQTRWKSWK
ncbi:putative P-loop containing nucleoside triphosphate hydrolase, leucine-rich repeat domain, L [Rosa chinensis]|uniref:Putative P-loop containing nucleoside triphosphate hydrolase, leucine-rich repeat domain, L n=1 Tax=Rosa chinensis TaxID=74649 RepID=A0A2P6PAS3_ROSCH|nr:disease resistance protein RPM1 [Rosa chinensis]XP_024170893.1 disease resistance protein RPM1 [Rosa chinensis]XP_024170894.1 disease resistance protein RPM1 [Rosa chinensis]PRQ19012.1 putative P-loop containing nucleoside triphosphate hydrolase, leucine-rich repeat domain, L [Rosa chinensis]